ncbi:Ig-like domain-containing protein, partial [Kaarinaea lacus]
EAVGIANITASTTTPLLTSNSVSVEVVNNKTASNLIVEPQWIGSLPVNRTQQLNALLQFNDNSTYLVTNRVAWSSDDEATAVVNNDSNLGAKGLVTAVSTGGASSSRVPIRAVDNLTSPTTATVDVTNATLNSVTIDTRSDDGLDSLPVGYSRDFYARGEFSDGSQLNLVNPGSWIISDPTIASFISTGATAKVRGLAPGNVDISYVDILADGSVSGVVGTISLTVTGASLASIAVTPTGGTLPVEAQGQFEAKGTFAGGLIRDITNDVVWNSTASAVAVFGPDKGKITTLIAGSSNITATGLDSSSQAVVSPQASLTVQNETIQDLLIPNLGAVSAGAEIDYTALASFTNSVSADYTARVLWSTSNVEIATVSNVPGTKGRVTFIKAGQVNLNATVPGTAISATPIVINVQ